MTLLTNDAEGGAIGAVVPTNATGSGDPLAKSSGAGSSITTVAQAMHGTKGYKFSSASGESNFLQWSLTPADTAVLRGYFWFDAAPPGTTSGSDGIAQLRGAASSTAASVNVVCATPRFRILSASGATLRNTVAELSPGVKYRYELSATKGATTTSGSLTFAYYIGDSATAVESFTLTNINTGTAQFTLARYGRYGAPTFAWDHYQDDVAARDGAGALIGPSVTAPVEPPVQPDLPTGFAPLQNSLSGVVGNPVTPQTTTATGTPLDFVIKGASSTATYETTPWGDVGVKLGIAGAADSTYLRWDRLSETGARGVAVRPVWLDTIPTVNRPLAQIRGTDDTIMATMGMDAGSFAGRVVLRESGSALVAASRSNIVLQAKHLYWIGVYVVKGTTTANGAFGYVIWDTDRETVLDTIDVTGRNTGTASPGQYRFGAAAGAGDAHNDFVSDVQAGAMATGWPLQMLKVDDGKLGAEPWSMISHTVSGAAGVTWTVDSTVPAGITVTLINPTSTTVQYEAPARDGGVTVKLRARAATGAEALVSDIILTPTDYTAKNDVLVPLRWWGALETVEAGPVVTEPDPSNQTPKPDPVAELRVLATTYDSAAGVGTVTIEWDASPSAVSTKVTYRNRFDDLYRSQHSKLQYTYQNVSPDVPHVYAVQVYSDGGISAKTTLTYTLVSTTTTPIIELPAIATPLSFLLDPDAIPEGPIASAVNAGSTAMTLTQTAVAAQPTRTTDTVANKLFSFNGAQTLVGGVSALGNGATGLTMFATFQVDATSADRETIMFLGTPNDATRMALRIEDGRLQIAGRRRDSDGLPYVQSGFDHRDSVLHRAIAVWDIAGARVRLYVDGELEFDEPYQTAGVMSATNSKSLKIGANATGGEPLTGLLGEHGIYQVALSTTQVEDLDRRLSAGFTPTPAPPQSPVPTGITLANDPSDPWRYFINLPVPTDTSTLYEFNRLGTQEYIRRTQNYFRVPFFEPGTYTYRVRRKTSTTSWSDWVNTPARTVRAWPVSGELPRWTLPTNWGTRTDAPGVITRNVVQGMTGTTFSAPGDYLLKFPTDAPLELPRDRRFDLNVQRQAGAVRIAIIGGGIHAQYLSKEIGLKTRSTQTEQETYLFIKGFRVSGGQTEDGFQISWNEGIDNTVIIQESEVERIYGGAGSVLSSSGQNAGSHSDGIQLIAGPCTLKLDRFKVTSDYQMTFLHPMQWAPGLANESGYFGAYAFSRIHGHSALQLDDNNSGIPFYSLHSWLTQNPRIVFDTSGPTGIFSTRENGLAIPENISNGAPLPDGDQKPGVWAGVQRGVTPAAGVVLKTGTRTPGPGYVDPGAMPQLV